MSKIIPFDRALRPALPVIRGNVDYLLFEGELVRIDDLLRQSGIEDLFIELRLEELLEPSDQIEVLETSVHQILLVQKHASRAIRCMVLKGLLGEGFRG